LLAIKDVLPYLLRRNLTSPQHLCDCDFLIEEVSRRNLNYKVVSQHGPSYLLKQSTDPSTMDSVPHEAAVYGLLHSAPENEGVRRYVPRFHGYDAGERILIVEFLRDAQDLRAYHARRVRASTAIATKMGDALGTLHREMHVSRGSPRRMESLSRGMPWVIFLHRPDLTIFREVSNANIQLIKIVQQFSEFGELLDRLRQQWKAETLIHSDIKWDNCLVHSAPGRKLDLKIVDWETAGIGDPCWDVGSVFMDYLSVWLLSIPIAGETPPDRFPELARYPLDKMRPAMQAFWRSYTRTMQLDCATADECLLRATQYAAARLIQTAYEQMQGSMHLTGNVVCFLQLSLNILRRPEDATVHLLGIPSHGADLS
jgi:hypothetical protein